MLTLSGTNFRRPRIPIIRHHTHRSQDTDDGDNNKELDEGEGFIFVTNQFHSSFRNKLLNQQEMIVKKKISFSAFTLIELLVVAIAKDYETITIESP